MGTVVVGYSGFSFKVSQQGHCSSGNTMVLNCHVIL